jgi:hypothetical protein
MPNGIDYTNDEWRESTGHEPLGALLPADRLLLHRHWMWANQQREAFDRLLSDPSPDVFDPGPLMMATREMGFMFTWYGLLWSVIEACVGPGGRDVDIRGSFRHDITAMSDLLRRCRNAVMHVPPPGELLDPRIQHLVAERDSATVIRRIHRALGKMFLEAFQRDNAADGRQPAG